MTLSDFVDEIKRRNILRVATLYIVASWIVLQIADIVFPALGLPEASIGYVIAGLLFGLPLIVAIAWWLELTPNGLSLRSSRPRSDTSPYTSRNTDFIIIGLLSVALVFFMTQYFYPTAVKPDEVTEAKAMPSALPDGNPTAPTQKDSKPSIAVLPFVNMSSDVENEYFSDGLTEELLNVLAQIKGLRVAGRTSSFYYKGRNENLTEVGKALKVNHILEGSVRKSGNRVRITAQLISAEDGFHLWSDSYDREILDIFEIQDEISQKVAEMMKVTLLTDGVSLPGRLTSNREAHDLYLRGKDAIYTRQLEDVERAMELFKSAASVDPEYAPPLLGIADAALILQNNFRLIDLSEASEIAGSALEKAAALGYKTSDYYATLGLFHSHLVDRDYTQKAKAAEAFEQAIALNENNVNAFMWYASLLRETDIEQSVSLGNQALAIDPLNRVANGNHHAGLSALGRHQEGIDNLTRLTKLDPTYKYYVESLALLHSSIGQLEQAALLIEEIPANRLRRSFVVLRLLWTLDEKEMMLEFLKAIPASHASFEIAESVLFSRTATRTQLIAEAEENLLNPDALSANLLATGLFNVGELELARKVIENQSINYRQDIPLPYIGEFTSDILYLMIIYELGEVDRAQHFAREIVKANTNKQYIGTSSKGADNVICYLVLGQPDRAIEELARAEQAGWIFSYIANLDDYPLYQRIAGDARVRATRSKIDARLDAMRAPVMNALAINGIIPQQTL